jgi:hypothetical protein
MILRIDVSRPVVWRSPTTVQLGLGADAVVLGEVSSLEERLLGALVVGTTPQALAVLAKVNGGSERDAVRLARRVAPALSAESVSRPPIRLAVDGHGPTAARIVELAAAEGIAVVDDVDRATVAVVVGQYSIAPARYSPWLNRDIAHLAVVHSDRVTTVGPFVEPGTGPCLYCIDRARTDADPAWPAIASQLHGRISPIEKGAVVSEVAALAVRLVAERAAGHPNLLIDRSFDVSVSPIRDGRAYRVHPDCGCRSPQGNATAVAVSTTEDRSEPTTVEAADVPA